MGHTEAVLAELNRQADERGKVPSAADDLARALTMPPSEVAGALHALRRRGLITFHERGDNFTKIRLHREREVPLVQRVLLYLRTLEPDRTGWITTDSGSLAGHFVVESGKISSALNWLVKKESIEVLKDGGRIIGIRLAAEPMWAVEPTPPPKPTLTPPLRALPPTPLLDDYRRAREMAESSRYLRFEPDPLAEEALALWEELRRR